MSTSVASGISLRDQNPVKKGRKKKVAMGGKAAKAEKEAEKSFVSIEVPCNQNDPGKQVPEDSICLTKKAPQAGKRKRGQKTQKLADVDAGTEEKSPSSSSTATSESVSELNSCKRAQKRSRRTVDEGTKLWIKKRRPSYRPEDQEAFYRLLEDPVIQSFLAADIFFKVTDKYLLSMVVEYFGRVGLPGHLYNRIHFFLALYIACDMEEDDLMSKRNIFPFLLGKDTWKHLYKDFLKLQKTFFQAMDYRAWVTPELCEEIQNQNPHHWVWSRVRQGTLRFPGLGTISGVVEHGATLVQLLSTPAIPSPQQEGSAF